MVERLDSVFFLISFKIPWNPLMWEHISKIFPALAQNNSSLENWLLVGLKARRCKDEALLGLCSMEEH